MATKKTTKTLQERINAYFEGDALATGTLFNKLIRAGIDTPEKLMALTLNDLTQIKGIGRTSAIQLMDIACDIAGKK